VGLYIPLFLSEVVGGNRKDKKACVILLVEKETELKQRRPHPWMSCLDGALK